MCKHILNVQVSIQSPCCGKWYECPECHDECETHEQKHTNMVAFSCIQCKGIFTKDLSIFDENDGVCPHCANRFVLPPVTPEQRLADIAIERLERDLQAVLRKH